MEDLDVLIVGAGPTGLVAAGELAARGVRCRIIDQAAERSDHSRALLVQARTLELLARAGLAEELMARGVCSLSLNLHVDGRRVAHIPMADVGIEDTQYPHLLVVSQVETERVLEARLESLGVRVERPLELVGLRQEPAAVVAELQTPSGREEVRAAYLIGADGAHSVVRKLLGLSFAGDRYPQDFLLADVDLDGDLPHGGVHLFMARSGVLACLPMKGERAYRVLATRGKEFASDEEPTLDEVRAVAASMSKISLGIESPRWLARFKLHHRIVDRYRHGRVFVAGDAAHIHSPAGGQGMNTGMQDADNLAWKLALVVTRKAPPALLESYEQERRPVGVRLLGTTDRLFRFGSSSDWLPAQLRRFVVPRVAPRVLGHPKRRARALRFVSQLGIRYSKSALSQGRSTKESLATGDRAPDGKLDDGGWLLARLGGKRFHVVAFRDRVTAEELAELARSFASFADIVDVHAVAREREGDDERIGTDASGVLRERYGCALCLLRPDGYIATRVGGDDPRALVAWLETHVGAKGES